MQNLITKVHKPSLAFFSLIHSVDVDSTVVVHSTWLAESAFLSTNCTVSTNLKTNKVYVSVVVYFF